MADSEPYQTFEMEYFCEISQRHPAVNYICKMLQLRRFLEFRMRLCVEMYCYGTRKLFSQISLIIHQQKE